MNINEPESTRILEVSNEFGSKSLKP